MRKLFFVFIITTFLFKKVSFTQVYGGQYTAISNAPFIVSLDIIGGNCILGHGCGGSILNSEWIITAAHCVDNNITPQNITVHAGVTNHTQDNMGQRIQVDQIILHNDWDPNNSLNGNDIALLHLSTPLCFGEKVQPIPYITSSMPDQITDIGTNVNIFGWGRTHPIWSYECEENLKFATLQVISNEQAGPMFETCTLTGVSGSPVVINENFISFLSPSSSSGQYDSGGPATINYQGSPLLIGITSWGCGLGIYPSIYTRVKNYTDFITNNITETSCNSNCIESDWVIAVNKEITQDMIINSNINVTNGATLTIKSEIKLQANKSILVDPNCKLIVDGGKITSCSDQNWRQIFNRGTVELINGATIENANRGILCFAESGPKIICNNANFINNQTGVSIVKSNTVMSFESTTFSGGEHGVYLDRSKSAPTFNNCSFTYQTKNGINAVNSAIDVQNGNSFIGCDNGIAISNLAGFSTNSKIGFGIGTANSFMSNNKGYYGINGDVVLRNNFVDDNAFGFYYSGQNTFISQNNTFEGDSYAEGLYSAGSNTNFSNDNIYNSDAGIFPWLENSGYSFIDNCFTTAWWDVNTPSGSQISIAQGNEDYAASNCFTKNNVDDFICETAIEVIYNIPGAISPFDPIAPDCMFPIEPGQGAPGQNYKTVTVEKFNIDGCGGSNFNAPIEYQYIINIGCDSTKLKKLIDSLKIKITLLKSKALPLNDADTWRLYFNKRHLVFALQQKAWCLRKQGKNGRLKDLYIEWAAFFPTESYAYIKSAEVSYDLGNTVQALSELNALAIAMPAKQNAIEAIKLSMDVMTQIGAQSIDSSQIMPNLPVYKLTPSQHSLLVNVATSSDPDAAYGRALLGYLTGEYLEPPVNYNITPRTRGAYITQEKEVVKFMPNPTSDYLNVVIDKMNEKANYNYEMIDLNGKVILNGQLQAVNQIDVTALLNGVYVLKITKDDIPLERQKIIIQK